MEEYKQLFLLQQYSCAICGKKHEINTKRFAVDHDHTTGLIRGILCHSCNVGLGHFRDSEDLLRTATQYILKYKGRQ